MQHCSAGPTKSRQKYLKTGQISGFLMLLDKIRVEGPPPPFWGRRNPKKSHFLRKTPFCRLFEFWEKTGAKIIGGVPWAFALCVVCFVGLLLLGSPCALASFVCPAWPWAASWCLLPPPPFCVSRFLSLPLGAQFFFSVVRPRCRWLFLVSCPGCRRLVVWCCGLWCVLCFAWCCVACLCLIGFLRRVFFLGMAVSRPKCNNKLSSVLDGWQ